MCSESDLKEVVGRLRDWFRVLHENSNHKRVKFQKPEKSSESDFHYPGSNHTVVPDLTLPSRPLLTPCTCSFAVEFEVGASPTCKEPLGWMFSRLDTNFDLLLEQAEIKSLYLDRNEPCSDAFFKSCDTHADRVVTSSEWCTCFQSYTGKVSAYLFICICIHNDIQFKFLEIFTVIRTLKTSLEPIPAVNSRGRGRPWAVH